MPKVERSRRIARQTRSTPRSASSAPLVTSVGLAIIVIAVCGLMFVAWLLGLSPVP